MAIVNGYLNLAEIKEYLGLDLGDTTWDSRLEDLVTAVSRLVDGYCHRRFYTTTEDEVRTFTAQERTYLNPGVDILSVTTLSTDNDGDRTYECVWEDTDYDLRPYNAVLDGKPYTWIEVASGGNFVFPSTPKGVKIVGKFGYSASTPAVVKQACLIQCQRVWRRKDAPFGVTGPNEFGQMLVITKLDPDVILMLGPVVRC